MSECPKNDSGHEPLWYHVEWPQSVKLEPEDSGGIQAEEKLHPFMRVTMETSIVDGKRISAYEGVVQVCKHCRLLYFSETHRGEEVEAPK